MSRRLRPSWFFKVPASAGRHLIVRALSETERTRFYAEVSRYLYPINRKRHRSENHAAAIRLWFLFREVEQVLGNEPCLKRFSLAVEESENRLSLFLLGKFKGGQYSADLMHQWACRLTRFWSAEALSPCIYLLLRPDGVVEPFVEWSESPYESPEKLSRLAERLEVSENEASGFKEE